MMTTFVFMSLCNFQTYNLPQGFSCLSGQTYKNLYCAYINVLCAVTDHYAESTTIENELLAHIEILYSVESLVVWGWLGDTMSPD